MFRLIIPLVLCAASFYNQQRPAQNSPGGIFEGQTDIGNRRWAAIAEWRPQAQEYVVEGAGTNMWFGHDEFHFVWKKNDRRFILRANPAFVARAWKRTASLAGWCVLRLIPMLPMSMPWCMGMGSRRSSTGAR